MKKKRVSSKNILFRRVIWLLLIYLGLKFLCNPEAVISFKPGFHVGLFNFDKKSFGSDYFKYNVMPVWQRNPYQTDLQSKQPIKPFSYSDATGRFILFGADHLGRDVFAGWINGLEIAIIIGIGTGLLSTLISWILASAGAWIHRYPFRITHLKKFLFFMAMGLTILAISWMLLGVLSGWIVLISVFLLFGLMILMGTYPSVKSNTFIDPGKFNRVILEFLQPIPDIILLMLLIYQMPEFGILSIIIILSLLRVPYNTWYLEGIARDKIIQLHTSQAKTMGFSGLRIVARHVMPLMTSAVMVVFATSTIRAILAESVLSFFGIGPTSDLITWGNMIRTGLSDLSMWWVTIFPLLGLTFLGYLIQTFRNRPTSTQTF